MRSIKFRILSLVLSLTLLIWAAVVVFTWWRASSEIHQVFDAQLVQVARMLSVTTLHESKELDLAGYQSDMLHHEKYEYPLIFQVWSADGRLLIRGPAAPHSPLSPAQDEGFTEVSLDGLQWRVYTLVHNDEPPFRVQVAHANSVRDELILKFVTSILKPLLFSLPFVVVLWVGVARGLAPLRWVADQISGRDQSNLEPVLTTHVPAEISALVDELNALFARLQKAIEGHSRFASNAAHELRNPIAGSITQIHAALNFPTGEARQRALEQALVGLQRLSHRLDQLLTLARIEPERITTPRAPLRLDAIATEVLAEMAPDALEKGVEIELQSEGPVPLIGNGELIAILICNLLQNAIRATPAGGSVTLRIGDTKTGVYLSIQDTGPGIPEEQRDRVFDRSHRLPDTPGPGFGLGLSIVQAIAEAHGASVSLSDPEQGSGLVVTVEFPA